MVKQEYIDKLVSIQGFSVSELLFGEQENEPYLAVILARKEKEFGCACGLEYTTYYDSRIRAVRDLIFGPYKKVWIIFLQCRILCRRCGVVTERLDWVGPWGRCTKRLEAAVALSCRETRSIKAIAAQFDLHWDTVKEIDKKALQRELPAVGDTEATQLAVDEFAIRKRHHYGTTVIDVENPEVLYVGEGRKEEVLSSFYQKMGSERCSKVEAVAMDMWRPYEKATREHCPNAKIVYDPFHVIQAYGRDVVDRVRVAEYRSAADSEKEVLKGSRYLLLKNKSNLDKEKDEPERLGRLLKLNRNLSKVYVMKDDLKQLWKYRYRAWAEIWFKKWYWRATHSRVKELKDYARTLKKHLDGILAHCQYPIHTGILEGVHNKVKVVKRIAYGFRDMEYFFLKIRGSFRPIHTIP